MSWGSSTTGDPMLALIDGDFDRYWAGSFEIPVRELLMQTGFEYHALGIPSHDTE